MCITAPARVLELGDGIAIVETGGRRRRASTAVIPEVEVGDWVMVGAGTILRRLSPEAARELIQTITAAEAQAAGRAGQPGGTP
jgi:hydrogenase expression/formation protein HypC